MSVQKFTHWGRYLVLVGVFFLLSVTAFAQTDSTAQDTLVPDTAPTAAPVAPPSRPVPPIVQESDEAEDNEEEDGGTTFNVTGSAPSSADPPGKDPNNRLEIIKTDVFEFGTFGEDSIKIRKLIGNVHLRQDTTDMLCDSAYQYVDSNYVIAWSNVRILMGGGRRTIDADKLTYDGQLKILDLYNNIVMQDSNITLYTDRMTYYRNEDFGKYFGGGRIVSEENVLTSELGYYYPQEDLARFRDSVVLDNPDYHLTTDTLGYNTETKVAFFLAPTYVVNDSMNTMYTEDGFYDTENDFAFLNKNANVGDTSYTLYADTISFDQRMDIGKAKGHIRVVEKDSGLTVFGKYGEFYSKTEQTFITDSAFAVQVLEGDTLFLFADTLASYQDTIEDKKYFQAYRNASVFMRDVQALCDSLSYWYDDSLLYFYYDPVLWSEESQLTGDTIMIGMREGDIDTMSIPLNAFIASEEDTVGYNQIKGKRMQAKFINGDLDMMWMQGNSESIYYSKNEEKGQYIGMNKATCTDMRIRFQDNKPAIIRFEQNPEGTFFPMHMVLFKTNALDGFNWRGPERPDYPEWTYPVIWPEAVGVDSLSLIMGSVKSDLDSVDILLNGLFRKQISEADLELLDRDDEEMETDSTDIFPADTTQTDSTVTASTDPEIAPSENDSLPDLGGDSLAQDSAVVAVDSSGKGALKVDRSGKPDKIKQKKRSLKEWWKDFVTGPTVEEKRQKMAQRVQRKSERYLRKMQRKRERRGLDLPVEPPKSDSLAEEGIAENENRTAPPTPKESEVIKSAPDTTALAQLDVKEEEEFAAVAREKAEREAREKAAQEQAAREAKDKAEEEAREKAAREQAAREAKEKAEREVNALADQLAREKAAREAKEKAEREANALADQLAREKAEEEAREKAAREKAAREAKEKAEREANALANQLAQEKAEREAQEKAALDEKEKAAQARAAQIAREKADREAREKAEREAKAQATRERAARIAQEKAEQAAREKAEQIAKEQAVRERAAQAEREKAEQEAREKAQQAAQEKAAQERAVQIEREKAEQAAQEKAAQERAREAQNAQLEGVQMVTRQQSEQEQKDRIERERLLQIEKERLKREEAARQQRELAEQLASESEVAPSDAAARRALRKRKRRIRREMKRRRRGQRFDQKLPPRKGEFWE
ncbi:MAG: OstA-like protein [Bacteroidota bacterium]